MLRSLLLLCFLASSAFAQNQKSVDVRRAVAPTDRQDAWWVARHEAVLAEVQAHPDAPLLLIGDSITQNYEKAKLPDENFLPTWQQFYASRGAINLGFSGDSTANVLWRFAHGELQGLHPKVAVVLIGTNNTGHEKQTAEETEAGIDAVVAQLEVRLPETHVLLLGLLPSDISPEKTATDKAVNRYLATSYGEDPKVTYLDIASIFFQHGALNTAIFYDPRLAHPGKALHPDTHGQRLMAEAMEPTLSALMGDTPRVPLASMVENNTALIPVPKLEADSYDWFARHHQVLRQQRALQPRVVMLGDSITHFWAGIPLGTRQSGLQAWQKLFGEMPVLNMGFGWDRTQNVLWRLRQGEFEGIAPEWIVLNIGTNNLTGTSHARASTPAEVVEAIAAIVDELYARSPQSRVMLMAIFPRGEAATSPLRPPIRETNRLLKAKFDGSSLVKVVDLESKFLEADGTLPKRLMPDGTHPSEAGYAIWADALAEAGVRP